MMLKGKQLQLLRVAQVEYDINFTKVSRKMISYICFSASSSLESIVVLEGYI